MTEIETISIVAVRAFIKPGVERKLFPIECVRIHPISIDRDDHVALFDKFLSSLKIYGEMNRIPTSPALLSDVRVDPRISP
jgi:hypothetical protein